MAFLRPLRALVVVLLAVALLARPAAAQQSSSGEAAIKAVYLYNFTKFVDWPEAAFGGSSAPFVVCTFGDNDFRRELRGVMYREQVHGRPITIMEPDANDDLRTCHLVYFGNDDPDRMARRLAALRQAPVLTVGEGQRFLDQGGQIAFVIEDNRVRFDIRQEPAATAGLTVSSKLLRVARQVGRLSP
jgi:YfiR/HmsC-like